MEMMNVFQDKDFELFMSEGGQYNSRTSSLLKHQQYTDSEQLMQDYNSFRKIGENSKSETLAPPYSNFNEEITEAAKLSMSTTLKIIQLRNIYQAHKNSIDQKN